ncbi:MAG TPA: MFS transporter [Acetobacteraceae bacterium]|nr:MFS transporter [Acetobacteraceae bacterium]
MQSSLPRPRPRLNIWVVLAASFATFAIAAGMMQSYTVFLVSFIQVFAWSRAESSVAYSVSQLVNGLSSPVVGALVDRLGSRRLVLLGGALLTLGLIGSAHATALWHVILLYGVVMTIGANCLGMVVFAPLISRHFVRRRGMAVSVLQSANGAGRAISAPGAQLLISGFGWRGAYLAEGALMGLLVLPLAMLFRGADRPATDVALAGPTAAPAAVAEPRQNWTLGEAMRTRQFWLLFIVYLCTGLGSFLVSLHQLAFAVDQGFDRLYAAGVLGMGSFLAIPGIILTGTSSDYIGRELSAIIAYGVSILGVVFALFITGPGDTWLLWLHACFFGLTWGARGPTITAKTADLFPGPRLGTILGVITVGTGIGSAVGAWAAGWVFDMTGSYHVAFGLSIAAYATGCVAFWALRSPPRA